MRRLPRCCRSSAGEAPATRKTPSTLAPLLLFQPGAALPNLSPSILRYRRHIRAPELPPSPAQSVAISEFRLDSSQPRLPLDLALPFCYSPAAIIPCTRALAGEP